MVGTIGNKAFNADDTNAQSRLGVFLLYTEYSVIRRFLGRHNLLDEGFNDQLDGEVSFAGGDHNCVGRGHERTVQHFQQVQEIDGQFVTIADVDDGKTLIAGGDVYGAERIGGIDGRDPLQVDIGTGELRGDVVNIIMHAFQDHVGGVFTAVASNRLVALDFLDPFQVDYGRDADKHVHVSGNVHLVGDQSAVQPLVKH